MDLLERAKQKLEESKKGIEIQILKPPTAPKIKEDVDFLNMRITQDDLWFLFKFKTGKGTRDKRSILLPKFSEIFNRNLNEMRK